MWTSDLLPFLTGPDEFGRIHFFDSEGEKRSGYNEKTVKVLYFRGFSRDNIKMTEKKYSSC